MRKLSQRQKAFIGRYLVSLSATDAAVEAGYSERTAAQLGYQLLQIPSVAAEINEAVKRRQDRVEVEQDDVVRELTYSAFSDLADLFDDMGRLKRLEDMTESARRSIAAFEVAEFSRGDDRVRLTRIRLVDKPRCLELLGRHLGVFGTSHELRARTDLGDKLKQARLRAHEGGAS